MMEIRGAGQQRRLIPGQVCSRDAEVGPCSRLGPPHAVAPLHEAAQDGLGVRVRAIAMSEGFEFGAQLAKENRIRNLEYRLGDIEDPPIRAESVDVAILSQALHHAQSPQRAIAAAHHILKPGGRVAFVEYRGEDPEVPIKPLHKMTEAQVKKEMTAQPLEYVETIRTLPRQHLIIFRKKAGK